jgi:hypothetical protein
MRSTLSAASESLRVWRGGKRSGAGQVTESGRWLDDWVRVFTENAIVTRSDGRTGAPAGKPGAPSERAADAI